jgi:glycosyltransferase involved in cell wall biosynthesis
LDSVKEAVDEIIIADTGSSDKTKEVAATYTDKIFDFEWRDDFGAARNFAFSKAVCDYQMWLDADDVLPEASLQKLLKFKQNSDGTADMVTMPYITRLDEYGKPILKSTRERLLKRANNYKWQDPIHECIPLQGNVFRSDIEIVHNKERKEEDADRNLRIYEKSDKSKFTPRMQYYYARELKDHSQWEKAAYYFERFLESGKGWIEDNISACFNLHICYENLGAQDKVLPVLLKSFEFDSPRAEALCEIGYWHKHRNDWAKAMRWFAAAIALGESNSLGFVLEDYRGYIPNIEICVCLCALGDFKRAAEYNERAASYRPDSNAVKINREFLAGKLSRTI